MDNYYWLNCTLSPSQKSSSLSTRCSVSSDLSLFYLVYPTWPQGYRTFFMLNSAEHEIFSANKYENACSALFSNKEFAIVSYLRAITVQLRWFFKIHPPPPPPPRTGGVDFLAHRGSSWYPTPIPIATDYSSTALPHGLLRKTIHLPVELRGGQKLILASSRWKISDVRMINSSEFFRVCMGRKSKPLFCLHIIRLICRWINTEIFLPRY